MSIHCVYVYAEKFFLTFCLTLDNNEHTLKVRRSAAVNSY